MDPIRTTADPAHSPAELEGCGPGRTAPDGQGGRSNPTSSTHLHDQRITRLVLCVDLVGFRRICPARGGWVLGAPEPEGAWRIVWMIKRMISHDAMSPAEHLTAAAAQLRR